MSFWNHLDQQSVHGVTSICQSEVLIRPKFTQEQTARLVLQGAKDYFENMFQVTNNVNLTFPINTEIGLYQCQPLLNFIENRAAQALRIYLGENYLGGDSLLNHRVSDESFLAFLEARVVSRHLLRRAIPKVMARRKPEDPLQIFEMLERAYNLIKLDDCRFVLEIARIREFEDDTDYKAVVLRFIDRDAVNADTPVIVTDLWKHHHQ